MKAFALILLLLRQIFFPFHTSVVEEACESTACSNPSGVHFEDLLRNFSITVATLEDTCKKLSDSSGVHFDYEFCLTSLQADPRSRTADPKGLAIIAIQLSKTNFTSTKTRVKELLKDQHLEGRQRAVLEDCSEQYDEGIDYLNTACRDIKSNNIHEALTYLSAALNAPVDCECGFVEQETDSLLTTENANGAGLAAIALALTTSLG